MKSDFTEELVDDLAQKLMIGLTREENKTVLDEFAVIKSNFDLINEIPNIKDIKPMSFALEYPNLIIGEDKIIESIPLEELLSNSDQVEGREIEVPKVVG